MSEQKTKIQDIKSLEEFDPNKLELLRGETPEDIKQTCLQLSKIYLGGIWLKSTIDDIEVKRISGGLTNQLYYCGISKPLKPICDEPHEVAIRLYGVKYFNKDLCEGNERLSDVIIGLLVSQYKLGPKIYGLFEKGQIMAYHSHKQFRSEEQKDPKLIDELGRKLARVHAMEVPINKRSNWALEVFDSCYEIAYKKFNINEEIKENNCQTLLNNDLKTEIEWFKKIMIKSESPIVFSHNDFRGSNIMVIESEDNNNAKDNNIIVLCDFEYSSYTCRGVDFGSFIFEWRSSDTNVKNPFSQQFNFPDVSLIKPFIDSYISESTKLYGKVFSDNKNNSFDHIVKETKIFILFQTLFGVLFCLKNDDTKGEFPMSRKMIMEFADVMFKNYFHTKNKIISEGLIEEIEIQNRN